MRRPSRRRWLPEGRAVRRARHVAARGGTNARRMLAQQDGQRTNDRTYVSCSYFQVVCTAMQQSPCKRQPTQPAKGKSGSIHGKGHARGDHRLPYRISLPKDAKRPQATEPVLALDEPVPSMACGSPELGIAPCSTDCTSWQKPVSQRAPGRGSRPHGPDRHPLIAE